MDRRSEKLLQAGRNWCEIVQAVRSQSSSSSFPRYNAGRALPDHAVMDIAALITDITQNHHDCLRREVARIEQLAASDTDNGDGEDDEVATNIRQLIGGLRACVEAQLSMEESVLFPMLLRLREQTLITPCRAGMIRGRVTVAERDLARIRGVVLRLRDLSREIAEQDESRFLNVIEALLADLREHTRKESELLFPWALQREAELTSDRP
jgi:iron-sulfur cluster repair protein YtfE (RIC family)